MNRTGVWSLALMSASMVWAGSLEAAQGTPAIDNTAKTSYVSDSGKSILASWHVRYAKKGEERLVDEPPYVPYKVQTLKMSADRQADSDTLLLIFEVKGETVWVERSECFLASQDGTAYDWVGFGTLIPATSTGPADMQPLDVSTAAGLLPASTSGGAAFLAFRLPPRSSSLRLKGLKKFPPIAVDLK